MYTCEHAGILKLQERQQKQAKKFGNILMMALSSA
jgi:hypothetical protein